MNELKHIFGPKKRSEIYLSDAKKYFSRKNKGLYSKAESSFSFIKYIRNWHLIVGKFLSENTIPIKLKNGQLIILTKHSVFLNEIRLMEREIIKKTIEFFPEFIHEIIKIKCFVSEVYFKQKLEDLNQTKENKKNNTFSKYNPKIIQLKNEFHQLNITTNDEEFDAILENLFIQNHLND